MDFLPPVVAKLIADVGEFNAAMGASQKKLEGFEAANARLAAMGKVAFAALAIGVAAVAYESIKLASNFDQTMELIHTQAGAAQSEVDGLKQKVLDLAPAVGIGPEKLAEGLYHIESTGFRGKEALDILTASAKLAAMGLADLDTVTFAMSGVMSVAMKDVTSAADATNYLNTIVGMGDMKMDKLAAAIGTGVLPSFKSAGLGMKDFGAALATISDNSVGADEAATRLRMTVALMSAPSQKAADALHSIGISETQLADDMRGPQGLLGAVMDLKTHLEESGKSASEQNEIISHAFGGGRSSSAILTLIEESDRLKSKYDQLGTSESRAAKADEAWAQQQKQFKQQMAEIGAEVQALGVKIGEKLIPYVQSGIKWMKEHGETMKIAGIIIGTILVVAIAAYTVAMIQAAIATLAATWEILLIIAAVALIAIGIYELVKHWDVVWAWIKRIASEVWKWLKLQWDDLWRSIMSVVTWIKSNIIDPIVRFFDQYLLKPFMVTLKVVKAEWAFAWGFLSVVLDDFVGAFRKAWGWISDIAVGAWNNFLKPTWNNIVKYGIDPLMSGLSWLRDRAHDTWNGIVSVAQWAWNSVLKPTWDAVKRLGLEPLMAAVNILHSAWDTVWHAMGSVLGWVYDHMIKPVLDVIMGAVNRVKGAIQDVIHAPGDAGSAFAHFLGFSDGGWVPGPPGAAQLVVVHGGEFVLSREMIASGVGGPGAAPAPMAITGNRPSGAGGGPAVIENHHHLYLDGRELHVGLMPHAQRYKQRNGVTGLS